MLSDALDSDVSKSWLREHSKYAGYDEFVVDQHIDEGRAWRDVKKLNPKKDMQSDIDL